MKIGKKTRVKKGRERGKKEASKGEQKRMGKRRT